MSDIRERGTFDPRDFDSGDFDTGVRVERKSKDYKGADYPPVTPARK